MVATISFFLGIVSIRATIQFSSGPTPSTCASDSSPQALPRGCSTEAGVLAELLAGELAGASGYALELLQRLPSSRGTLRSKLGAVRANDTKGEQTKLASPASSQSVSAGLQSAVLKLLEKEGEQTAMISELLAENHMIMQKMQNYEQELNDTRKELISTKALAMSAGHESREAKDLADHADHTADSAVAVAHDAATAAQSAEQEKAHSTDFAFRLPGVSWFMSDVSADKKDNDSVTEPSSPTAPFGSPPANNTAERNVQSHAAEVQNFSQGPVETFMSASQTVLHTKGVASDTTLTSAQLNPVMEANAAERVAQTQAVVTQMARPSTVGQPQTAVAVADTAAPATQQAVLTAASIVESASQGEHEDGHIESSAAVPVTGAQSIAKAETMERAPIVQPADATQESPLKKDAAQPQMDMVAVASGTPDMQASAPGRAQAAALAAETAATAARKAAAAAASAVQSAQRKQVQERIVFEGSAQPPTVHVAPADAPKTVAAEVQSAVAQATQQGMVTRGLLAGQNNIQSHTQTEVAAHTQSAMQEFASGRAEAAALAAETAATAAQNAAAAVASALQSARGEHVQDRELYSNSAVVQAAQGTQTMQASTPRHAEVATFAAETAAAAAQQFAAGTASAVQVAREEQVQKTVVTATPAVAPTALSEATIVPTMKAEVKQAPAAQPAITMRWSPTGSSEKSQIQTAVVVDTPSTMQASESGRAEAAAAAAENAAAAAQSAAAAAAASVAQSAQQSQQAFATASRASLPTAGELQAVAQKQKQIASVAHASKDVQPTEIQHAHTLGAAAAPAETLATASRPAAAVAASEAAASEPAERAAAAAETAAAAAAAAQTAAVAAASAAQSAADAATSPH